MAITPKKLEYALQILEPSDWKRFETLCEVFLASEFDDFRTMAAPSGDRGRDGELVLLKGKRRNTAFQFSVQSDWRSKAKKTLTDIKSGLPRIKHLVFLSNQQIGATGDDIRAQAEAGGIFLDFRDRSWFLERVNLDENRSVAAQELYNAVAAQSLDLAGMKATSSPLTSEESKTLFCFLELQYDDEKSGKGFTKSCFEALLRAALRNTSSEKRITRDEIYDRIAKLLPQHGLGQLKPYIDSAIERLDKTVVKYNRKSDDYHLSHEEQVKLVDKAAAIRTLRLGFISDLRDAVSIDPRIEPTEVDGVVEYVAEIIERYLSSRGEQFASALANDSSLSSAGPELSDVILRCKPPKLAAGTSAAAVCESIAKNLLRSPSAETLAYLGMLSDCYTLFAFLAATPDVQKITKKLFDHGEIWLDTNVVLPALAEQASEVTEEFEKPFTALFRQLGGTAVKVYVTKGVVEEIIAHLNRCLSFARSDKWRGEPPYLAAQYLIAGKDISGLPAFIETFVGHEKPEEDLAEFLDEELGINVFDPPESDNLSESAREEITKYWHLKRTEARPDYDPLTVVRIARVDSENYINVLNRRSASPQGSWYGYTSWWLTLDSAARKLLSEVSPATRDEIRHQPILSLDFAIRYLTFGPLRSRIDRTLANPLEMFAPEIAEAIPLDLIEHAQRIRAESGPMSERLRRRRIRSDFDRQRATYGPAHQAGLNTTPKSA
jgi:hypothetical protein